jgi:Mlc titration factor MtfA (ptsG expression regulator)
MEAINDNKSDIRNYGGTNEAEFFAVASEYFFERPDLLQRKHPELYKMLADCFQQDIKTV